MIVFAAVHDRNRPLPLTLLAKQTLIMVVCVHTMQGAVRHTNSLPFYFMNPDTMSLSFPTYLGSQQTDNMATMVLSAIVRQKTASLPSSECVVLRWSWWMPTVHLCLHYIIRKKSRECFHWTKMLEMPLSAGWTILKLKTWEKRQDQKTQK